MSFAPRLPSEDPREAAAERLRAAMGRPWATLALSATLFACHVAVGLIPFVRGNSGILGVVFRLRGPRLLRRCGAMHGPSLDQGELWRLVSASFLHVEGVHLVVNTFSLLALGALCEALYGRAQMLGLFVVSGAAGAAVSWLAGNPLSVGASGGLFGMMGAVLLFHWRHGTGLPLDLQARLRWLGPLLLLNLLLGFLPFLDGYAHAGGLAAGVALGWVLPETVVSGSKPGREASLAVAAAVAASLLWAAAGVSGEWP